MSDHVHGKILGAMSVSGFIPENSQFELSVSVSVRFGTPGIWSDRFAPSMDNMLPPANLQKCVSRLFVLSEVIYSPVRLFLKDSLKDSLGNPKDQQYCPIHKSYRPEIYYFGVMLGISSASSKPTTEFAQPRFFVGSTRGRPQRGGTNLGVFVPIWPVMRMPGQWPAI